MKLAFSNLGAPAWPIERVAQEAARLGYDGIELRLLDGEVIDPGSDRSRLTQAVDICRAHGLAICALDTSCRFNDDDPDGRARQVQSLLQWISLAHQLAVPVLRVFGGAPEHPAAVDDAVANGWVVQALEQVADAAEQAGVTVALETHDAFSSARRVARVLWAVDSSRIGALWDGMATFRAGETAEEVVNLLGPRIAHVHVKDGWRAGRGNREWQLVPIGDGDVPVREQLRALEAMGYQGYVSVEWEKKWHPELAEPEVALPQHVIWLRSALARR